MNKSREYSCRSDREKGEAQGKIGCAYCGSLYKSTSRCLSNLLAVIHRDGGHYEVEHGSQKASEDAMNIVLADRTELRNIKELKAGNLVYLTHPTPEDDIQEKDYNNLLADTENIWRCKCGSVIFFLTESGPKCRGCGIFPADWAEGGTK